MKKQSIYILLILLVVTGAIFHACNKDHLERPPLGSMKEDDMANKKGIDVLLIGAYAALDGQNIGAANPWEAAPSNWVYGSVGGGDAHKGSDAGDQPPINLIQTGRSDPSNGYFNSKWRAAFEGVYRTNTVLRLLEKATDVADADRHRIKAEARFLRGHYYFELRKMFQMVPWIDETVTDPKQPNNEDVFPKIEADFKFAVDSLPETQTEVGRVNKWAAVTYLGKTLLYQHKYAQAKTMFDQVISQGVTSNNKKYGLTPKYEDNFDAATKNNEESVFAIQMVARDGTNTIANANMGEMLNFPYNSPFRCCGFYQPSQDLVNSFRTDGSGLPYLSDYNSTPVKNDKGINSTAAFTPDNTTLDPRLDWTVGRRGVPYHDWGPHPGRRWIRDQAYSGPYAPKKNVYWQATQEKYYDPNSWAPGTAINALIIRYADVLLMAAECEVEVGSLAKALEYVNMVRQRAANREGWVNNTMNEAFAFRVVKTAAEFNEINSPAFTGISEGSWIVRQDKTPNTTMVLIQVKTDKTKVWNEYAMPNYKIGLYEIFSNQAQARNAVRFERKLELAMEGVRFFDLSRWGIAAETMNAYYKYESGVTSDLIGASFTKNKNEYYPVPQRQIDLSVKGSQPTLQQLSGYK
jgi:tetratricopeptide (TPR) repeat protein